MSGHCQFIVGPEGEFYKCWEDVGNINKIIGNVHLDDPISNTNLIAQYCIGANPFQDTNCSKCDVLPICGGGCPKRRLEGEQKNFKRNEFCSIYKNDLLKYLKAHCKTYRAKKIINAIINPDTSQINKKGFKNISTDEYLF